MPRLIARLVYALAALLWLGCVLGLWAIAQAASVTLTWDYTQSATPAVAFTFYRQPGCTGPFTPVQTLPVTSTTWTDTQLQAGQTYCWYATAVSAAGQESMPSNVAHTVTPPTVPKAPTNLR